MAGEDFEKARAFTLGGVCLQSFEIGLVAFGVMRSKTRAGFVPARHWPGGSRWSATGPAR